MYYIYAYIDPRNGSPFYIGKGKNNRKSDHLREHLGKTDNVDKVKIIKELAEIGLLPSIVELENNIADENLAYNRETYYILKYGRMGFEEGGILTNKALHGHPPKPIWDNARKKQHSEWNKKYWTPDRIKEHKEKNLVPLSEIGRNKIKDSSLGTVSVVDINGNGMRILKEVYDSIDRSGPINTHMYVSVSSSEAKRRRNTP